MESQFYLKFPDVAPAASMCLNEQTREGEAVSGAESEANGFESDH